MLTRPNWNLDSRPSLRAMLFALIVVLIPASMIHGSVIDPTFGVNGEAEVAGDLFAVQPNGKIISIEQLPDGTGIAIRRYLASGLADLSFGLNGAESINPTDCTERAKAVAIEPGGRVVVALEIDSCESEPVGSLLVRFNVNGKLDQSFGAGGIAILNDPILGSINALAIQPDGKIVFAGNGKYSTYYTMLLGRCTSAGVLDRSFGRGGVVLSWYEGCAACPPQGVFESVSINPDGTILAGGLLSFAFRFGLVIAKYNHLGRQVFLQHYGTSNSGYYGTLRYVKEMSDGKIVGIGEGVTRFLPDGLLDPTFPLNGAIYGSSRVSGHGVVMPNGNILRAYRTVNPSGLDANSISLVSKYGRSLGTIYTELAPFPLKAALAQPDGKIIVITDKMRRYTSIGSATAGWGLIGYFRPTNGRWSIRYDNSQVEYTFGVAGDIPTPRQYRKAVPGSSGSTTLAGVYRPSDGNWYISTTTGYGYAIPMTGSAGEQPVGGDYDGDGYDDFTLFQNGHWRTVRSSDWSTLELSWGTTGDLPVRGDYDRDGIDDRAIFRPGTGVWYILRSTDGAMQAEQFGLGTDRPVPGDYDGDGRTDLAVFRPSNGAWYIHNSFDGSVRAVQFGISSDRPVPADYDGDQITDLAVFRDGTWYIAQSGTNTLKVVQWGQAGDVPLSPGSSAQ